MFSSGVAAYFNRFADQFEEPHFGWQNGFLNLADVAKGTGTAASKQLDTITFCWYFFVFLQYWAEDNVIDHEINRPHFSFFLSIFERIAKKILLAQINANFSSTDDISSDSETQGDESDSDGHKEVRQREESSAIDEDGKCFPS